MMGSVLAPNALLLSFRYEIAIFLAHIEVG